MERMADFFKESRLNGSSIKVEDTPYPAQLALPRERFVDTKVFYFSLNETIRLAEVLALDPGMLPHRDNG
jgi:hypothetical protein